MKNLNEQSDRIKQLFTEERLYGNLILESSKIILTEDKVIDKGKNELGNSFKLKKDNKGIFTLIGKKNTQLLDYDKNGNITLKKEFDPQFQRAVDNILASMGEEGMFYDKKSAKLVPVKIKGGYKKKRDVLKFKVVMNGDGDTEGATTSPEEEVTTQPTAAPTAAAPTAAAATGLSPTDGEQPAATPTDGEQPAATPTDTKTTSSSPTQKGDFTAALTQIGGSQEGHTYEYLGGNKAQKLKNGKVVANYVKTEGKINMKSLFESVMDFNINNAILPEGWGLEKKSGEIVAFNPKLSDNFDKAISKISDETGNSSPDTTSSTQPGELSFGDAMTKKDDNKNIFGGNNRIWSQDDKQKTISKAVYKKMKSGPNAGEIAKTLESSSGGWTGQDQEAWAQSAFESITDKKMYDEVANKLGIDPYDFVKEFMEADLGKSMHNNGKTIDGEYARITGGGETSTTQP